MLIFSKTDKEAVIGGFVPLFFYRKAVAEKHKNKSLNDRLRMRAKMVYSDKNFTGTVESPERICYTIYVTVPNGTNSMNMGEF